jgi:hypothetical protein
MYRLGPDSTGVGMFAPGTEHHVVLCIKLGDEADNSAHIAALTRLLDRDYESRYDFANHGNTARLVIKGVENVPVLASRI